MINMDAKDMFGNGLIKKWRAMSMLHNVKLWLKNNRDKDEIINIIDNYMNFLSSIGNEEK